MEIQDSPQMPAEKFGLVRELENGRIMQIGLTTEQSIMLHAFLVSISKEQGFKKMPESFDLVLKSRVRALKRG